MGPEGCAEQQPIDNSEVAHEGAKQLHCPSAVRSRRRTKHRKWLVDSRPRAVASSPRQRHIAAPQPRIEKALCQGGADFELKIFFGYRGARSFRSGLKSTASFPGSKRAAALER